MGSLTFSQLNALGFKIMFFQDYENNQEFLKQVNVESLNKYLFFAFFQDYENNQEFLKQAHHLLMEIEIINGDLVTIQLKTLTCNSILTCRKVQFYL